MKHTASNPEFSSKGNSDCNEVHCCFTNEELGPLPSEMRTIMVTILISLFAIPPINDCRVGIR